MSYGSERDQQYLDKLQVQISDFISNYNANPGGRHITLFLFPGGLGSQLVKAEQASQSGPPFTYDMVWLDCGILSGAMIELQNVNGIDVDYEYVLPDQCVNSMTLRPYEQFKSWCQANYIDLFIFGWDWRLKAKHAANFFLDVFLPVFESRTRTCVTRPLSNFWLLGHSFGGMVVKQIMNEFGNSYVQSARGAITVGTPFYGGGTQVHRFFKGDPLVNGSEGASGAKIVTEIISPLPAGYELLFLDSATYDTYAAQLANDPEGYNLNNYPSLDADAGTRADPYHPVPGQGQSVNGKVRYLSDFGFDWTLLNQGLAASRAISQPLDASVAGKFINIRGIQTSRGGALNETVKWQTWSLVPPSFDPDWDPDPFGDVGGPGDGVIPAWSARLISAANVFTIKADDLDHMDLMNHAEVQRRLALILTQPGIVRDEMLKTAATVKMKTATRADLNQLIDRLRKVKSEKGPWSRAHKRIVREILIDASGGDPRRLQEFMARAYMDLLKTESQLRGELRPK